MTLPMSPTSVLEADTESSTSSHTSSLEINIIPQDSDSSSPQHTMLNAIRKLAKGDAERQHASRAQQKKLKVGRKSGVTKEKNKRQRSNIRSAEICRAARGFYVQRMEQEILRREEAWLQITKEKWDLIAKRIQLEQRIRELEEKKARKAQQASPEDNKQVDNVMNDLLLPSFVCTGTMDWEFETEDQDFMNDTNSGFFMNDMQVPITPPPPPTETTAPMTPQNNCFQTQKRMKKMLRSPVSLFDFAEQAPQDESLRANLTL